jgi:hypothetical protein
MAAGQESLLGKFATKAVAEAAKAAATFAAAVAIPQIPVFAEFAGGVTKELVDALLARTSAVEKKLDLLLREPLRTGLHLLGEAAIHTEGSDIEMKSRESLLDDAHKSFVRALSLLEDSREDSTFIRAIDCLALSLRAGRTSVAEHSLVDIDRDLMLLRNRTEALEQVANALSITAMKFRKFFHRDRTDYRDVPFGYDVQVIASKSREKEALAMQTRAEGARFRLILLESVVALAHKITQVSKDTHR